jgi:tripartite-type tricarboxylate transporter receptor subunit TctC
MKRLRRTMFSGCIGAALLATIPLAFAQSAAPEYPTRPIRIIVAFSAGTASDTMARAVTDELGKQIGVPVVVENRDGAGGHIGQLAAARAPADGYTLLMGTTWLALTPHTINPPGYDPLKDFTPIAGIGQIPMVVVAGSSSPNKTWADLVARAKTTSINYGTSGKGGASHVFTEVVMKDFGFSGQDVGYKNTGQAMIDVATGKVDFYLANLPPTRGLIQSGQLVPLAVGSKQRIAALPDTPTLAELLRRPDYEIVVWYGFFTPAGTPPAVVARLQREIAKAADNPVLRARFEEAGGSIAIVGPARLGDQVKSDYARFGKIVKDLRLEPGQNQ